MKSMVGVSMFVCLAVVLLPPMAVPVQADLFVSSNPLGPADTVKRYSDSGTYRGDFATNPDLINPNFRGLAFGPDRNLYVSHFNGDKVLRFNGVTGGFIDTFVPSGSGGLDRTEGLTFGPDGNLYVASEYGAHAVLRYNGTTGAFLGVFAYPFYTVPDGRIFPEIPMDLAFGPDGNLYVAITNNRVIKFDGTTGAFLGTFVASGNGLSSSYNLAFGPDGNLYVSSNGTDRVLRYNGTTGAFLGVFASGGGLDGPRGLAFGPDGDLYVSSYNTDQVLRYDGTTGVFQDVFASGAGLDMPTFLTFYNPVPVPGAALLGVIGLACASRLRRRNAP